MSIQLPTLTISELHAVLSAYIQQGAGTVPVCATDGRARYPFEAYTVLSPSDYTDALLLSVRPDAHFAQRHPLPLNWSASRVAQWNAEADRIKTTCGAFCDRHHPDAPSYSDLKSALERIWQSAHPDASEHAPELRRLTEAAYGELLVSIVGKALGRL